MAKTVTRVHLGSGPYDPLLNVGIYCRVSSTKRRQTESLNNQVQGLCELVRRSYRWRLCDVYTDQGSGRSAKSREGLQRLLIDCEKGKIEQIVTKSISRFGRNTVELLSICRRLKEKNIDVYFEVENIHSLDSNGELTMTLYSAVAEGESFNKSESIKWGLARSAKDPDSALYSKKCYGYKLTGKGLVPNPKEAEVVKKIFDAYLAGKGSHAIKKMLEAEGIPSPTGKETWPKSTIEKILCNEKYCGVVVFYKTYMGEFPTGKRVENVGQHEKLEVKCHHEAIIDQREFDQVQEMRRQRSRHKDPDSN